MLNSLGNLSFFSCSDLIGFPVLPTHTRGACSL